MQSHRRLALWLLVLLAACGAAVSAQVGLRGFDAEAYRSIVDAHRDRPFVLGFWSLDCPPCLRELEGFGRWFAAHPGAALVLVNVDENASAEVRRVLEQHGLDGAENWALAVPFDTRVRFTIDPSWYGELPRTYLFDADNSRRATSGLLGEEALDAWWHRNAARLRGKPAIQVSAG